MLKLISEKTLFRFDWIFSRETYFDGAFGVLVKVIFK